jgi:hypothetical protein
MQARIKQKASVSTAKFKSMNKSADSRQKSLEFEEMIGDERVQSSES